MQPPPYQAQYTVPNQPSTGPHGAQPIGPYQPQAGPIISNRPPTGYHGLTKPTVYYQPQQYQRAVIIRGNSSSSDFEAGPIRQPNLFTDTKIRHAFIRKVYAILFVQLLITFGIFAVFAYVEEVGDFAKKYWYLSFVFFGIQLIPFYILTCNPQIRRTVPINFVLLFVFTVCFAMVLAFAFGVTQGIYYKYAFVVALGITLGLVVAITLFSLQTKIDFTKCQGIACILLIGLMLMIIGNLILYWIAGPGALKIGHFAVSCAAVLIFSFMLIIDTQMVVGGKHRRYQINPEDYVEGAIIIYMDIVYIFYYLYQIIGMSSDW